MQDGILDKMLTNDLTESFMYLN